MKQDSNPIARFVAKAAFPADVARILGRCRHDAETGCLTWTGTLVGGKWPRVHAPDPATGGKAVTVGRRGVWLAMTGQPVFENWRVFGTCTNPMCLSPAHIQCGSNEAWGQHLASSGQYKASPKRIAANRIIGQHRRKVSDADLDIIFSGCTLSEAAKTIGVHLSTVHRYRQQKTVQAMANNPFAGLLAAHSGHARS